MKKNSREHIIFEEILNNTTSSENQTHFITEFLGSYIENKSLILSKRADGNDDF